MPAGQHTGLGAQGVHFKGPVSRRCAAVPVQRLGRPACRQPGADREDLGIQRIEQLEQPEQEAVGQRAGTLSAAGHPGPAAGVAGQRGA